ncbi:zinc finger CCHC domain-containing protein 8 [Hyperolius riggenbachi]|uniref:zinc finger CCHC domain-containing protein 8 n=1 Tax=Hyperolius riggenbachi TaxID=752182 RepID=UPI0035A3254E
MAEVEFGDSELFEQLDGDVPLQPVHIRFKEEEENSDVEPDTLQEQLSRCEETIAQLRAENQELKRKLKVLSRPSGLFVEDKFDGPLLQILFMNHVISKQYHQEIEDFVSSLVEKYEEQNNANPEKTTFSVKPQPSSFLLEECESSGVDTIKKIKEAFSVVGSVLYFTNFCLDKLGQPLLNENPQLTDGWEVPKYQQAFAQIVSLDGQEVQVKAKRPKPCCFNCGLEDHQLKDCPKPRDLAHIGMKRKEFMDSCAEANQNFQQRYHAEEVEERFGKFKPGIISLELQDALGITDEHLPPFIYRMRQLGYPPGWLKDAELETSGLSLYDGRDASDGEIEDPNSKYKAVSYDVSKLVSFPGFNVTPPSGVTDDWRNFGSIPMQPQHHKEIFGRFLDHKFPKPNPNTNQKRLSSQSESDRKRQKTSTTSTGESPVDMEMESDAEPPYYSPTAFKFQPPLPPYSTPPPLPRGTPPSTPHNFVPPPPPTPTPPPLPKGTPPPTPPYRSSPSLHLRDGFQAQTQGVDNMDDDALTLEQLEEQQRLIWAALENAENTNSDSDANTPLNGNSVASSPSRTEMDLVPGKKCSASAVVGKSTGHEPDNTIAILDEDGVVVIEDTTKRNGTAALLEEMDDCAEEAACGLSPSKPRIPDRSKFAEGITPFEFENMAESTGTYLKLRSVLKNSPRNQQRSQK